MTTPLTAHRVFTSGQHNLIEISGEPTHVKINEAIGSRVFEVVSLPNSIDLFVDEEGLINGSKFNLPLTIIAHQLGARTALFGAGVFLGVNESTGETVSLTADQSAHILKTIASGPDEDTVAALAETLTPIRRVLAEYQIH